MPLIKTLDQAVAAASVINPWQGNQYEFLPFDALIEIALLSDAGDAWDASVFSGSDVLMQNSRIDALALATPIQYPEDFILTDVAAAGERLGCQLTNQSGIAADVRTVVRITPV